MLRFICTLLAVALLVGCVLVMYPSILQAVAPGLELSQLIPGDVIRWDEAALGLGSFPFYGGTQDFYGFYDVLKDLAPYIEGTANGPADVWGHLGQISRSAGFLQALYSFIILSLLSIPVYALLRMLLYNRIHDMMREWPFLLRLPGRGVATLSCGVSAVCLTWLGYNTLVFQNLVSKLIDWIGGQKLPQVAMNVTNILMIVVAALVMIALLKVMVFRGSVAVSVLLGLFRTLIFVLAFAYANVFAQTGQPLRVALVALGFVVICGIFESIFDK